MDPAVLRARASLVRTRVKLTGMPGAAVSAGWSVEGELDEEPTAETESMLPE